MTGGFPTAGAPTAGTGAAVVTPTLVGLWADVLTVHIDNQQSSARIDNTTLEAEIQR